MSESSNLTRRRLLTALTGAGIGSVVFQRALTAQVEKAKRVTPEMIKQAEWIAGYELTERQRLVTAALMTRTLDEFKQMRAVDLDNSVAPALVFDPQPWHADAPSSKAGSVTLSEKAAPKKPDSEEKLAFLPVTELSALIRERKLTSTELTKLYLKRLKQYDPGLLCVVNLTEKLALEQAARADREIAAGRYRGPLHGIPWGAKDLIAYPGYPTTWGCSQFEKQTIDTKATVAQKLEDAGAVLIAKLSLGALAMGDQWFKGKTRNPWDQRRGSSGSSAGSASATAAGLVGFALGSETLGSIVSPCRECGTSGLRPTFGRVSRHGCMALSWSMDKIGPIARSLEDCALILGAIHGADGHDAAAVNRPFSWPLARNLTSLKVGYFKSEGEIRNRADLKVLSDLGVKLIPIELPKTLPHNALRMILFTEAATVFDEWTRQGKTEGFNSWPFRFRLGEMIPAVEYLRANRIRSLLMQEMNRLMEKVDAYVGGDDLVITNLTGHPSIVMPKEFRKVRGTERPYSIKLTGRLFGESELLALGHACQQATGAHLKHPDLSKLAKLSTEK